MSDFPNFAASYDRNAIWISRPNEAGSSDPLIIYLHGGGYYFEAQKSQFESVMAIYLLLKPEMRRKTSILFLDYKLASHGYPIPYQLDQLRDTYINLCKRDGHSNVTLLGDSAGGHLALSFLKHLSDVKEKLVYPKKLILVSPWVDLTHNATTITPESSYMRCKEIDMIDCRSFELKLPDVLGESDPFSLQISPALKPSSKDNWESIVTLNDNQSDVLIIMGEHESLTDEITKFCKNCLEIDLETSKEFKENYVYTRKGVAGKCNVRIFMEPHGIHDSTFFFEQDCLSVIKSKRDSSGVLHSLDRNEYFGIVRISEFLNETMYVT